MAGRRRAALLCLLVAALGIVANALIGALHGSEGYWYRGPGGFPEAAAAAPWQTWHAAAIAYALCGALMLAAFALALARTRSQDSHGAARRDQGGSVYEAHQPGSQRVWRQILQPDRSQVMCQTLGATNVTLPAVPAP